ncbi:MAG TPA: Lrp/AsnC family transcriptional regulator [Nitrososphaera sp.]|nr:Lrp/AsnC family transcriptional regulator [Nitrososphaera sp.]
MSASRKRIVEELTRLGVYETSMDTFSDNVLEAMLSEIQKTVMATSRDAGRSLRRNPPSDFHELSQSDIKILKLLANSKERLSGLALSKKLNIPVTTAQRRRKKLENEFLSTSYSLKYEKFGLRKAILFINTVKGNNEEVGRKLLLFNEVLSVHNSIGNNNIDLHAEILITNNSRLLSLIESIKAMDGVKDVAWSETLKEIGTNTNAIIRILDGY